MANYSTLKAAVADVVKTNGNQAITGANLQSVLLSIINSIGGGGYIFKGVATPSTNAGTPDENVFYIGGAGTYANFGTSVTVPVGSICVFKYNGSWSQEQIKVVDEIGDANTFEIITPIGFYCPSLPSNSVGNDNDYILFNNANNVSRVYQKMSGAWTNVTSSMNVYNYYLWQGLFYKKESLADSGEFVPINANNINRINIAGSIQDFTKSNLTLTEQTNSINTSYENTVYKVDVAANVAGNISKSISVAADKGVSIGFLIKSLNNESDLEAISVRYQSNTSIYYKEKRQPLGDGWYFINYYQWNTVITAIMILFDMRGRTAGSFLISDLQICENIYPLHPNYAVADNILQKKVSDIENIIDSKVWNIIPLFKIGTLPAATEGSNGDYTILRNSASDNRLYQKIDGAWVNVLASVPPTNLYFAYGTLYYFSNVTGTTTARGTLNTFLNDNVNRVNLAGKISDLIVGASVGSAVLTKEENSIGANYINNVYKFDVSAGAYGYIRKTGLSLSACTCALLCKVENASDLDYLIIRRQGGAANTYIPYKKQYIGNGWYFIYAMYDVEVTTIDFAFDLRNIQSAKTYYISDIQVCEGLLPLYPNYAVKDTNITDNVLRNDWNYKILSTYGDSVTAHCNGDFTNPFDTTTTNWANKVASYYNISKAYNRGIGGQTFVWGTGGGSIAWCTADGNYVNRKDGTTYDDYLNPATQASVLSEITALGYNSSIHTLVRGCLSSWLRIKTMYPASIKDTIDVVLVQSHNDANIGSTKLNAELSWVSNSNLDAEWAASSQYQTYGGDYNIQDSLKGAIASTIMKLQAWMPQAVIVLMTPISGRGTTGELNVQLVVEDMQIVAEKVREVHRLMSIPLVDMYANDGINGLNRTTFISDSIHPFTQAGSKALARTIIGGLKSIEPNDLFG